MLFVIRNCLLILLLFLSFTNYAQCQEVTLKNIGDNAPEIHVQAWIKGEPINKLKKGRVYVVEFWATWCKPCIASMPHLSALTSKYKNNVTVLGISIYEQKFMTLRKIKNFVDSMGSNMDFNVAIDDSDFMATNWFDSTGQKGIPKTFVINKEGKIAWIGHPTKLNTVLPKILNDTWNIKEELIKLKEEERLKILDDSINYELMQFIGSYELRGSVREKFNKNDTGSPHKALKLIAQVTAREPKLKYAPFIGYQTLNFLLKTNISKAYEFGKFLLTSPPPYGDEFNYNGVINPIETFIYKFHIPLPSNVYELGANAYQMKIDDFPYPDIVNIPKYYHQMAAMYWLAKNKTEAIKAETKAIEILKNRKDFLKEDLTLYQLQLLKYKKQINY
ncbi:MAG: TlpA family protein disulfide reductase [Bacteroidetes bacterium]|nr:TlpA family protein disulfide reductase [Bacteroidota bacterium]